MDDMATHEQNHAGLSSCKVGLFCTLAAVLCALLHLSKVAMNLKSLIKDDHWMHRVRRLIDRLSYSKGLSHEDSIFDTIYGASMSNYPLVSDNRAQPGTSAPPGPAAAWLQDPQESDEIKAIGQDVCLHMSAQGVSNTLDGEQIRNPERHKYRFENI
jgi:hypothetical protein